MKYDLYKPVSFSWDQDKCPSLKNYQAMQCYVCALERRGAGANAG